MPADTAHSGDVGRAGAGAGQFRRDLGWFSLLTMSLGTVIGSGRLMLPAVVAADAGAAGVLCWAFAGVLMMVIALVYAELGAAWPAPGAVALYPRLSHGSFTGHLAGWAALISYAIIPPAEAVAVTRYAGSFAPALVNGATLSTLGLFVGIGILALIGALNFVGVRYLGVFQNWVTSLKYIPILLFVIGVGVMAFRQALDFGGEARRPGRDFPLAVLLTMVIAIATYVLVAIVFTGAIDWPGLSRYGVKEGDWGSLIKLPAPLYNVSAAAAAGVGLAWLIFADGLLSPNGPNATNVGSVPRVAYMMAENGTMPRIFMRLDSIATDHLAHRVSPGDH